ncbi:MAG: ribonuclease J [Candidatus Paceibacterota bacterium]|jgi:ribonuclease J|nr:ribonuclease J [Candidatus Paceibacterota bacterium]HQM34851.1 ribonuclease J [Candidatus Paceibacterota bacterium]
MFQQNKTAKNFKQSQDKIKICVLGGVGEVGRNLSFIEYRNQILVFDCGLRFPEEDMPGIDFIIPNVDYLEKNRKKILGMFITHAHYDHIGAIPYIVEKLGNPTIYTAPLTRAIILKRQEDFPHQKKMDIETIDMATLKPISVGNFRVHPYLVNHNVPDTLGFAVETFLGTIFYMPDFKVDFSPIIDPPIDLGQVAFLAAKNPLVLMMDSTGAEEAGHSISERGIYEDLERIFERASGRIIVATFASLISRLQQIIWLSEKFNRRVVIDGYSMKSNVEVARMMGYLKINKNTLISPQEAQGLLSRQLTILCTGSQGEDRAVLMRIANREHKYFRVEKGDTVIFSSSVVPGNERTVQNLKDTFYRQGARVFHYKMMDIHAGGHAQQEELKLMLNLIRPKFLVPIHGQYSMLQAQADIAEQLGMKRENIVIANNGQIIEVTKNAIAATNQEVPANYVMVDGLGVGDVGEVVLRDRHQLSKDGMLVIVTVVDGESGELRGDPEISSRGFVYLKESQKLMNETKQLVKDIIQKTASKDRTTNWAYVKDNLRDKVGEFLFKETQRRPMILPFIVEI